MEFRRKREPGCRETPGGSNESLKRNFVHKSSELSFIKHFAVVSYENPCTRDHELDRTPPG